MPGINDRVFGSDIDNRIKKKLEARQLLAEKDRSPLEQIRPSQYPDDRAAYYTHGELNDLNFDGVADLSSRTPFVRMWTAVEIRNHTNKNGTTHEEMPKKKEGIVYQKQGGEIIEKEVSKYERIVYELGNHNVNEFTDVLNQRQGDALGGVKSTDVIPNVFETNNNEFMKPAAGITSVTSNTEGMLGVIKKTSVNFIVHNFHDYDKIYSKYFLRPGAQVFVDFGWDSLKELYKPQDLMDNTKRDSIDRGKTIEDMLFGDKGYVTNSFGDLETLIGIVSSFDSKIKENGSVECSLEITSKNSALIQNEIGRDLKERFLYNLDVQIMLYVDKLFKNNPLGKKINTTDLPPTAEDLEEYQELSFNFASANLSSKGNIPNKKAKIAGVYWQYIENDKGVSLKSSKNIFISFGFFEDFILNSEFGFGKTLSDILNPNYGEFSVSFDSSNTYVPFNENLLKRQKYEKDATKLKFLYVNDWSETYNTKVNKFPINRESTEDEFTDKKIPLREIFINLKLIKDSINKSENKNVDDFIKFILDEINKDSLDVFNLNLINMTKTFSKMSVIDRNFLEAEKNKKVDFFDKLFMFKPMSKNSIVKSYDLSITTPKGEFQSMLAIQSMSTERTLIPLSDIVDKNLSLTAISQDIKRRDGKSSDIGVVYLPEIGGYQTDKIEEDDTLAANLKFNFDIENVAFKEQSTSDSKNFLDEMSGIFGKGERVEDVDKETSKTNVDKDDTDTTKQEKLDELRLNIKHASDISHYYELLISGYRLNDIPTILPVNLSLSIYGISSLLPGDLFKVDYLPERQRNLVYFQVTKVSHNINSSTWTTSLDTVMRIRPNKKLDSGVFNDNAEIVLSKKLLQSIKLHNVEIFFKYILKLKPVNIPDDLTEVTNLFEFTCHVCN